MANKLFLLLREYEDVRYAVDTFDGKPYSQRFLFDSREERFAFVKRLSEINAEYFLFERKEMYMIEVFLDKILKKNDNES